ncbi:hypothetical protein QLR68_26235, partial [Micromonospora sp. DH15]|nr:hypothetical protein [Micromonospora sp. DH15]
AVVVVVPMGRAPWTGRPEQAHDDAIVAESMRRCDVIRFAARPVPTLSGGEQARAWSTRSCGSSSRRSASPR